MTFVIGGIATIMCEGDQENEGIFISSIVTIGIFMLGVFRVVREKELKL